MIVRVWQTLLDPARADDYEAFARERSLPMFRRHDGLLDVLFLSPAPDRRAVVTVWRDASAAAAIDASPDYLATVEAIGAAGFLRPPQRVDAFEVPPLR